MAGKGLRRGDGADDASAAHDQRHARQRKRMERWRDEVVSSVAGAGESKVPLIGGP